MSATFDLLVPGYVIDDPNGDQRVRGTVVLVRSGPVVLVADPGMMESQAVLAQALHERKLSVDDVTHVFVSHHHLDHTRNIGMFPAATVIDADSIYRGDIWDSHSGDGYEVADGVSIIHTQGHSAECASLVIRTGTQGVVVYTHAWWFSDMTPAQDPLAYDQVALDRSRIRILELADLIVPAHGEPFTAAKHH